MKLALAGPLADRLEVSSLVPTPFDLDDWHRRVAPSGSVERRELRTRSGWPIVIFTSKEPARVTAFYTFFEYSASAEIADELSDELLETLRSAEPDWRAAGLVTCLAELFG
jgi:hypothetical protein